MYLDNLQAADLCWSCAIVVGGLSILVLISAVVVMLASFLYKVAYRTFQRQDRLFVNYALKEGGTWAVVSGGSDGIGF